MGCTSSAPTALRRRRSSTAAAAAAAASAAENKHKLLDGDGADEISKEIEEINMSTTRERVLPASDTVETNLDVDSSNELSTITTITTVTAITANDVHIDPEPWLVEDVVAEKNNIKVKSLSSIHGELVPEDPVEPPPPPVPDEINDTTIDNLEEVDLGNTNDHMLKTVLEPESDSADNMFAEETPTGVILERRPTRWEALADVAAELPPKLTVDPLTGQIYALSRRD